MDAWRRPDASWRLNRRWSIVLLHYPALIGLNSYCRAGSTSRREARRAGATAARTPGLVAGCLRDLNQNSLLTRGRAPTRRGTPCRDGALPSPGAITEWTPGRADGVLAAPWDARGRYKAQSRGRQWRHRHVVAYDVRARWATHSARVPPRRVRCMPTACEDGLCVAPIAVCPAMPLTPVPSS